MTPQQLWFWFGAGVFGLAIVGWFAAARIYLWRQKRLNAAATPAMVEPVSDDPEQEALDHKWDAYWHQRDLEFRASDLWQLLHEDETDLIKARNAQTKAALNKTQTTLATGTAQVANRGVRRCGYAGLVDMTAQWVYSRRRSVKRMVAVLEKAKTWPPEWQRQLDVLLAEGAVARARDEGRAR